MDEIPNACLIRAREQAVRAEILNKDSAQPGHYPLKRIYRLTCTSK